MLMLNENVLFYIEYYTLCKYTILGLKLLGFRVLFVGFRVEVLKFRVSTEYTLSFI